VLIGTTFLHKSKITMTFSTDETYLFRKIELI
jgi:hypothetical protein